MKLVEDIYKQIWFWVDDADDSIILSPRFDYEADALLWKNRYVNDDAEHK
jgi:hypothetical protein